MALTAEELEALATNPQSMSGDAGSLTERSAEDILKLSDRAAATDALTGTNDNGGPKSAWRCVRMARASMPGAR